MNKADITAQIGGLPQTTDASASQSFMVTTRDAEVEFMNEHIFGHQLSAFIEDLPRILNATLSRRTLLKGGLYGAGMLSAAAILAACGGKTSPTTTSKPVMAAPDVQRMQLFAGVENVLVSVYATAASAITSGAIGTPSPALVAYLNAASAHHISHAASWNTMLKQQHQAAYRISAPGFAAAIKAQLTAVTTLSSLLAIAALLETTAGATYLLQSPSVVNSAARSLATSIAPVEAQHVSLANLLAGSAVLSGATFPTTSGRTVADLTSSIPSSSTTPRASASSSSKT